MTKVIEVKETQHTTVEDVLQQQASSLNVEDVLQEPASSLNKELIGISEEIRSIDAGFQAQLKRALADARTTIRQEFQKELDAEQVQRNDRARAIQTEVQS